MMARVPILAGALIVAIAPAVPGQSLFDIGRKLMENADVIQNTVTNSDVLLGTIDDEQERRIGATAGAVLLGAARPVDNPEVQQYVNDVGRWLALHTERPELRWRFAVLEADTINAFAAPGGYAFVTRGLFLMLRNEHELAGVLAHEMAHVLARHHVNALVERERVGLAAELGMRAMDQQGLLIDALIGASKELYASGLSHADEHEADRMGVVIAERAGYDPYGLVHALKTLQAVGRDDDALLAFFSSTHPPLAGRLERLQGRLAQRPTTSRPAVASQIERLQERLRP
jgi:predicted Zn-dependent protease